MTTITQTDTDVVAQIEAAGERMKRVHAAAGQVIFGQETVIEQSLITLLAGGHALLIGVPGLAKTLLVETLGKVLGLDAKRIQFTPDLMPSDIIGSEVLEEVHGGAQRQFRFIQGPIFTQLLMADEINRASPKTQSACCRRCRSIMSPSPAPATMCPSRSTCWQPRTRWSRKAPIRSRKPSSTAFFCRSMSAIPISHAERRMLYETTGTQDVSARGHSRSAGELMAMQRLVRLMPVPDKVVEAILEPGLVRSARPGPRHPDETNRLIAWGPGPRASQALMLAVRAKALDRWPPGTLG